jgi:protein O-mannosyl-transferase
MEIVKSRGRKGLQKIQFGNEHLAWYFLIGIPLALIALGSLFYYPSLSYNFQFDDIANITKSFDIRSGSLKKLFLSGPRWISYWLNAIYYSINRFNPFPYRLGNLCIHTLASIMLFFFLYYALSRLRRTSFFSRNALALAAGSAGIFLLHPVQTQTVSYVIQGQLEGMAGFLVISTAFFFLRACQTDSFFYRLLYNTTSLFCAFLSCGSKEIAIMTPFLLVLTDWVFIAQGDWNQLRRRLPWHGCFALVIWSMYLYFLTPTFFAKIFGLSHEARNNIGNVLTQTPEEKILPIPFFISQFKVIVHYLWIFLWPFSMSVEYDWKLVSGFFAPDCIFPLLFLLACLGLLAYHLRTNMTSVIGFAALWFIIAILPRSSVIPSSELLTDYKTYLASVGIALLLASALVFLGEKLIEIFPKLVVARKEYTILASLMLTFLPLGYATYSRNKVWRTAEEFWLDIIHHAPGKARAYNNYAVAMSERGDHKSAIPFYLKAISMDNKYPDPLNNIAVAYAVVEELDKAIEALKQAIAIQPHYPEAYNNLASFFIKKEQLDNAEQMLAIATQLRPHYGKAYFNWGKVYLMRNNPDKAFEYFKKACLEADLDNEAGYKIYAEMSMRMQKHDHAITAFKKLMEVAPSAEYLFGLANAYFSAEKLPEAAECFTKLTKATPNDGRVWYNLGETYIKLGNLEAALSSFDRAQILPNPPVITPLRRAYCLGTLGKTTDAITLLQQTLTLGTLPPQLKKLVENMLVQLQQEFGQA